MRVAEPAPGKRGSPPSWADARTVLITLLAFLGAACVAGAMVLFIDHHQRGEARAVAANTSQTYVRALDQTISQSLSSTYALAALVREGKGAMHDFEGTAREMLSLYPGVATLQLAPDGIIRSSMPLAGNEKALGHDLLSDPTRNKEAFLARETGKLTLAGPFELKQGGVAAIGRLPVFLPRPDGSRSFWGFTTAMLRFPEVLEVAGLQNLLPEGYQYELSRIHPDTGQKQIIAASRKEALVDPVESSFSVPNGAWTLSIMPVHAWREPIDFWFKVLVAAVSTVLFTLLIHFLQRQPQLLRSEVARRTLELKDSEAHYRSIIDLAMDAILIGAPDGTIIDANQSATRLSGYPGEELAGMNISHLFDPEELAKDPLRYDLLKQGIEVRRERTLTRKDGSTVPVEMNSKQMPNGTYQAFLRDLSERKRTEEAQLHLQEEMIKSQRLESLGHLAGGIAHDFNNILTGILGNVSLAQALIGEDHKAHQRLKECEAASYRASELARQLLTFSRGGEPVRSSLLTRKILEESLAFSLHGSNVKGELDCPAETWNLHADSGQMSQLFNNLFINAKQAMHDGGRVDVTAANLLVCEGEAEVVSPGRYVSVAISDQGSGISAEDMPHIFDPYFTTKSTGNGLGLASCYSIIKRHEGAISVKSAPGRGTVFTLLIPATEQLEASVEARGPETSAAAAVCEGSILIMDDEAYIRDLAEEMMQRLGYRVESCRDGKEAVRRHAEALAKGSPYDAIILDLTVPGGMGGKEAATLIRQSDPLIPLIVSSGYANDSSLEGAENNLFNGAVAKPYSISNMAEELARVISSAP